MEKSHARSYVVPETGSFPGFAVDEQRFELGDRLLPAGYKCGG